MSHYTRFFGFDARPFDADGGQSPIMGTHALKTAFRNIESALDEGVTALRVSGPHGVGKSSLARALPRLLDGSRRITLIRDPNSRELENALDGALFSSAPEESETRPPILIIDDAEYLPAGSVKKLHEAVSTSTDAPRLTCILLMTSAPTESSSGSEIRPEIEDLVTEEVPLEPLSEAGVSRYIRRHLERVGGRSEELFPDDAVEAICRLTGGLPREVSRLCEELLETAAGRQVKTVDPEWLEQDPEPESEAVSNSRLPLEWAAPGSLGKPAGFAPRQPFVAAASEETSGVAFPAENPVPRVSLPTVEPRGRSARWVGLAVGFILVGALGVLAFAPFGRSDKTPEEPTGPSDTMTEASSHTAERQTALDPPTPSAPLKPFEPQKALSLTISSSAGPLEPLELATPRTLQVRPTHKPQAPAGWIETQQMHWVLEEMADALPELQNDPFEPEDN